MLEIGGMTVEEMRARMSQAEYVRWIAFFKRRYKLEEEARKKAEKEAERKRRRR